MQNTLKLRGREREREREMKILSKVTQIGKLLLTTASHIQYSLID